MATLAATDGIGTASSAVGDAVDSIALLAAPRAPRQPAEVRSLSSADDQYKAGYAWGDPRHVHAGRPGLERVGVTRVSTSSRGRRKGPITVSTAFVIDEQAHLWITLVDARGRPLLLTQRGSRVSKLLGGPQTKDIQYLVLVPRRLQLTLRIPGNLMRARETYRIQLRARSPLGSSAVLEIPFQAPA